MKKFNKNKTMKKIIREEQLDTVRQDASFRFRTKLIPNKKKKFKETYLED